MFNFIGKLDMSVLPMLTLALFSIYPTANNTAEKLLGAHITSYDIAAADKDRQIFYMENGTLGVRQQNTIRFYRIQGDAEWKEFGTAFRIPETAYKAFYFGNMTIGVWTGGSSISFYQKRGEANWTLLRSLAFTARYMQDPFPVDDHTIAVRIEDTVRQYEKLGEAKWRHIRSLDLVVEPGTTDVFSVGNTTLGLRVKDSVHFFRKLGQANWRRMYDLSYRLIGKVDEIIYTGQMTIGVRQGATMTFFKKMGQAEWKPGGFKKLVIKSAAKKDYSSMQEYLKDAPKGVGASFAWSVSGGKGEGIKVFLVENKIDVEHEDLKAPVWMEGSDPVGNGDDESTHGTAVAGILFGQHNGFGINGLCPSAQFGISSIRLPAATDTIPDDDESGMWMVAEAIDRATAQLDAGDVLLIEETQANPLPDKIYEGDCQTPHAGNLPVEYDNRCFEAIRRATAKGIIVVEPAGNGMVNLDDSVYGQRFNRAFRDSRAIMVAADRAGNRAPACWSNYGSRIDYFAWGGNIVTTAGGDLGEINFDYHTKYTAKFGGTSGAAPIVAGVIVCLQGIRKQQGRPPLTAEQLRGVIKGTPAASTQKNIGIEPDLKASVAAMAELR